MRTTATYQNEIKEKYNRDKDSGTLRGNLYNLTPNNIRKVCLNILDDNPSERDKSILKNFYNVKLNEDLRTVLKKYELEKLKPICNFLKKENRSIQSADALELIALVIDFSPRPYSKYRTKSDEENDEKADYVKTLENERTVTEITLTKKDRFNWFTTVSRSARKEVLLIIAGIAVVLLTIGYFTKNSMRWMVWENDNYVEVKWDVNKYSMDELKIYKEDRIKFFRKIPVACDTMFFQKDGSVRIWYGKNLKKELEYFTDLGLHPETGKTLKPISQYMIDKYICLDSD